MFITQKLKLSEHQLFHNYATSTTKRLNHLIDDRPSHLSTNKKIPFHLWKKNVDSRNYPITFCAGYRLAQQDPCKNSSPRCNKFSPFTLRDESSHLLVSRHPPSFARRQTMRDMATYISNNKGPAFYFGCFCWLIDHDSAHIYWKGRDF